MGVQRYGDAASLHNQVEHIFGYHRPNYQETMDVMGLVRKTFKSTGHVLVGLCPMSPDLYEALDDLDKACMHAIASLARFEPKGQTPNTTSHPQPGPVVPHGSTFAESFPKDIFSGMKAPEESDTSGGETDNVKQISLTDPEAFEPQRTVRDNPQA